jgi:hypothetical protein
MHFLKKRCPSRKKLNSTMNTPLPLTTVNRRAFIKTSILTAAAVGVLSQGKALAQTGSGIIIPEVWEYALWCKQDPLANHAVVRGRQSSAVGGSVFVFQAVQDISKSYVKGYRRFLTSSVYFYMEGHGPNKDAKARFFRFKGRVHSIVSIDSRDGTPQQKLPGQLAVFETDPADIAVKGTIDLDIAQVSLVSNPDGSIALGSDGVPKVEWYANPTPVSKVRIPGINVYPDLAGPLHLSGYVKSCATVKGAATVDMAQITQSSSSNANVSFEYEVVPGLSIGGGVSSETGTQVQEPNATTIVKGYMDWKIHLVKRKFNSGGWIDLGEVSPPTEYIERTAQSII